MHLVPEPEAHCPTAQRAGGSKALSASKPIPSGPCQEQATNCRTKMQACGDFPFDSPESPPWRRPSPTDCPAQHGGAKRTQLTGQELLPSATCRRCSADRAAKRLRVSGSWPCASMPRSRDLTFDMSGRLETAQLAQGCPLDGVVRCHCSPLGLTATSRERSNAARGGA